MLARGKRGAYDWSQSAAAATARIEKRGEAPYEYRAGVVPTRDGYVLVYMEPKVTQYRAIVDGVEYCLSEHRGRTPRGAAVMAGKWIARLIDEVKP